MKNYDTIKEFISIDKLKIYDLPAICSYSVDFRDVPNTGNKQVWSKKYNKYWTPNTISVTTYTSIGIKSLKEGRLEFIESTYEGMVLYTSCKEDYKYKKKDSSNLVKIVGKNLYVYFDRLEKSMNKVPIDVFEIEDSKILDMYEKKEDFRNQYFKNYKKRKDIILDIDISKITLDAYSVKFFQTMLTAFKNLSDAVYYMCSNFEITDDMIERDNAIEKLTNKFDECVALLYNFKHITDENKKIIANYIEDLELYTKINEVINKDKVLEVAALAGKKTAKYVFKKAKLTSKQKQELMCYDKTIKLYAIPKQELDLENVKVGLLNLQDTFNDDSDGSILLDIKIEDNKLAYYFYTYDDGTKIDGQRLAWLTNLYNQKNTGKKLELDYRE